MVMELKFFDFSYTFGRWTDDTSSDAIGVEKMVIR